MKKLHQFDEVFDSQALFRIILTAMSNPTRYLNIAQYADKLFGNHATLLAAAMTLLDNEVSFSVCGSDELREQITLLTHAVTTDNPLADYIFVTAPEYIENSIASAKCGTLADPHKSATLIMADNCTAAPTDMSFRGPGIDITATIPVSELVKTAIAIRDQQNYEYPQGIDMIFISNSGELLCIPRTTQRGEE